MPGNNQVCPRIGKGLTILLKIVRLPVQDCLFGRGPILCKYLLRPLVNFRVLGICKDVL